MVLAVALLVRELDLPLQNKKDFCFSVLQLRYLPISSELTVGCCIDSAKYTPLTQ